MRLPLIPLSPYIQTSFEYAKVLAQTTKLLSEEENVSIKTLLEKTLNKEREKLDRLTKSMQTIQSSCLLDFNIYDIAKEIAFINCSLFRMVTLNKNWLCNFDKQSNMVPLLDFHRYLSHSFAHQIIYGDPKKKSVIQLIHLAYILLHVYRDFSGCTAILTSLQMPEVRRLQSMWAPCPPKLIHTYQELVVMLAPDNNYEAYHHQLWVHTNRFLNITPSKSQMIAIPFMHAHLALIQNLVQTHASVQAAPDIVLSSAGQPLLTSTVQLLEFCQQFSKIDPLELEQYASAPTSTALNRRLSFQSSASSSSNLNRRSSILASKAIRLSTSTCLDLDLLRNDAKVYHWIVSRAYLTRSQLHSESLHAEPLDVGEIELEPEEEYDLYWDFFHKDFVAKEANAKSLKKNDPPMKPSRSPKAVLIKKPDPVQEEVDGLSVDQTTDTLSLVNKKDSVGASSHSKDQIEEQVSKVNSVVTDEPSNISKSEADSVSNEEPSNISQREAESVVCSADRQPVVEEVHDGPSIPVNTQAEPNKEQPKEEAIIPILKVESELVQDVHNKEIGPVMSPEVSRVNGNEQTKDEVVVLTEEDDEEWTGYPLDNTPSQTHADPEEEEEEEWTGYPITSQDEEEDDEEEEVWKGYPIPIEEEQQQEEKEQQAKYPQSNDDDNDDDDEARKSPVEVPSPSTPSEEGDELIHRHEEWKGYQKTAEEEKQQQASIVGTEEKEADQSATAENSSLYFKGSWNNNGTTVNGKNQHHRHHQLNAIGKAAARRMQYSLSSTDTNSKRLPSPFAPSSST